MFYNLTSRVSHFRNFASFFTQHTWNVCNPLLFCLSSFCFRSKHFRGSNKCFSGMSLLERQLSRNIRGFFRFKTFLLMFLKSFHFFAEIQTLNRFHFLQKLRFSATFISQFRNVYQRFRGFFYRFRTKQAQHRATKRQQTTPKIEKCEENEIRFTHVSRTFHARFTHVSRLKQLNVCFQNG